MKLRSALMTAAVSLALAGLAGCGDREPETTTGNADTTTTTPPADTTTPTTPPAATTPPAGDATATTPPPGGDSSATAPSDTTPPPTTGSAGSADADRSAGQAIDDATVTAKVKAALMAESGVDGTKINVDTFNGRVTLKGEVPDQTMIDKAVQVAKSVEGVKDVDNRLIAGAG